MTACTASRALLLALLPLAPMATSADAAKTTPRRISADAPVKDCTRLNGRVGYYANPWCTPAEQDRFDRWDAKRVKWR